MFDMLFCKMFGKKQGKRYPHTVSLSDEGEYASAALMLKEKSNLSHVLDRAVCDRYSKLTKAKKAELEIELQQVRKEQE